MIPLFDIDGTLFKTADPVHYEAFSFAFKNAYGIDAKQGDPGSPEGRTDSQIVIEVMQYHGIKPEITREKLKSAMQQMTEYFDEHKKEVNPQIISGVKEILFELKKNNNPIGVLTGNVEGIGWTKIERAGLRDFFDFGAFGDKAEIRSQLVEIARKNAEITLGRGVQKEELVIIGDTPRDYQCAKDAGIKVILVATGRNSFDELQKLNPDLVVKTLEDNRVLEFLLN